MTKPTMSGVVYVLKSTGKPGICKIGYTTRSAAIRAAELEEAYGYAKFGLWEVVRVELADDCERIEQRAHHMLRQGRTRSAVWHGRGPRGADRAEVLRPMHPLVPTWQQAGSGTLRDWPPHRVVVA